MPETVEPHLVSKGELRAGGSKRWQDASGLLGSSPTIRRMLLGNPLSASDDDPVQAIVCVGDRVAGRVHVMPGELRFRGEAIPALWGFNLEVSPEFRGKGIATEVVRCWRDARPTGMGTWVNQISSGIYPKLGWTTFHTPVYQLIYRTRRFVDGFVRPAVAAKALASLADAALGVHRRLAGFGRVRGNTGLHTERVERMSPEFDEQLVRPRDSIAALRSARVINWLLDSRDPQQREDQRLYYVRDSRDRVIAYFLLALNRPALLRQRFQGVVLGALKDWRILDETATDDLSVVLLGLRELAEWGADALLVATPGFDESALGVLRKLGFTRRDDLVSVFHAHEASPLAGEQYRRPELWRHAWADSDGFYL